MTTSLFGTLSKDKAPVEETTFFSSISMPGNEVTSEPVAITIFFALILVLLFSSRLCLSICSLVNREYILYLI